MIGPTRREKRPGDVIANAVHIAKIETGDAEKEYVDQSKQRGGREGSRARAEALRPKKRQKIAKKAAAARWDGEKRL